MEKILIIGGGIAGLSAGIYAQQAGFESEIFEQHSITGGLCTGWNRGGYHIDGCIHWMTGTEPGTELNEVWENLGALTKSTRIINLESMGTYYSPEGDITIWRDMNRFKQELLALSPEDEELIAQFIADVEVLKTVNMPARVPLDMMSLPKIMSLGKSMQQAAGVMKRTDKITCVEYGKRFKHPAIQKMFAESMPKEFGTSSFLFSIATFSRGNGGIPEFGSLAMVKRMEERYLTLGGKLHKNCAVQEIKVSGKLAEGVQLADGSFVSGNYIISTCPPDKLFQGLLQGRYADKALDARYKSPADYPVTTSVICSFAVEEDLTDLPASMFFETAPFKCGNKTFSNVGIRNFAYEKSFAPKGHTVIEVNIMLNGEDYPYWKELYSRKEEYAKEKENIAEVITQRLEECLPELKGKITAIDVATPITFERYTGAYKGAWMGFVITPRSKMLQSKGKVKGLNNVYFAGQWTQSAGGLPVAAVSGKFAVQRLCKKEKRYFPM